MLAAVRLQSNSIILRFWVGDWFLGWLRPFLKCHSPILDERYHVATSSVRPLQSYRLGSLTFTPELRSILRFVYPRVKNAVTNVWFLSDFRDCFAETNQFYCLLFKLRGVLFPGWSIHCVHFLMNWSKNLAHLSQGEWGFESKNQERQIPETITTQNTQ